MEKRKHLSQRDIAKMLGISASSVSRALKGSKEVSPELCEKVKSLAQGLNYRPNPFAMSLRYDAPHIIGVVVPNLVTHFFSSILKGIQDCAISNGYFVIITSSNEKYIDEVRNIQNLVNMHVDGIIACLSQETTDYSHLLDLEKNNVPLVLFDRVCLTDHFSTVMADSAESARKATLHLIDNGAKRPAFIGGSNHLEIVQSRKHGYIEALHERNIKVEPSLVVCHKIDYDSGVIATRQLLGLPSPPDAILAINDMLAFAAMEEIKRHNLRIPDDISLIGYTDEEHACYVEPKLTAVSHQTLRMGDDACKLLLERINGSTKIRHVIVPSLLQVRGSSVKNATRC